MVTDPPEAAGDRGLRLASDEVGAVADALEVSARCERRAAALADRADLEHDGVNRSPAVVAGAAVYLAALASGDERTQTAVAEAAGVSTVSIRAGYRELAAAEGFDTPDDDPHGTLPALRRRFREEE